MNLINLKDVNKTYHLGDVPQQVLFDINLTIRLGEMLAIMGHSGSGKSTLMNLIGLLDRPDTGFYRLRDQETQTLSDDELAELRNHTIGFVFQQFFLLPRLTAEQNVALPLLYRNTPPAEARERVMAILKKVGMAEKSHHRPNQLSGGQQQRVAIARALVGEPDVILADEPTGSLDSRTGEEVIELFQRLHYEEKRTVILVTHDPLIGATCPRLIEISDGRIIDESEAVHGV
jgi:putative ABC transport system ATP-binding protein